MNIKGVIIHCSDSKPHRGDTAETIHRWHKERGWDGIGYHKVILENGNIENGRPLYWPGAHAKGYNDYVGICLMGIDEFTDEQFYALNDLIQSLVLEYGIQASEIKGHYEVSSKTCPNFDVSTFKIEHGIA